MLIKKAFLAKNSAPLAARYRLNQNRVEGVTRVKRIRFKISIVKAGRECVLIII